MSRAPQNPDRRRVLKTLATVAVGATTGTAGWGYFYERHHLTITRTDVPVRGLPPSLKGLRIALLTDLHRSETVPAQLVQQAAAMAVAVQPDIVVLGGDYVTWGDRSFVEPAAQALSSLRAQHGVFAVLGNHDDDRDMPAALTRRGFTVLRDARTTLEIRGERIDFLGIRYWTRKLSDIERVLRGGRGLPILLAHDPRRLDDAARLGIPLVLSGHTHGGQVAIPGLGAVMGRKFPVMQGLASRGPTTLFVSRGVGTVYVPVRVNCPPEVAVLTLVPQET